MVVWFKSAAWRKSVVWHKSQFTLLLLAQGLRARNIIHAKIEENIRAKMARKEPEGGYKDALQLLMEHTQGNGEQLNMQVRFPSSRSISFHPASLPQSAACLSSGLKMESRRCCPFARS